MHKIVQMSKSTFGAQIKFQQQYMKIGSDDIVLNDTQTDIEYEEDFCLIF